MKKTKMNIGSSVFQYATRTFFTISDDHFQITHSRIHNKHIVSILKQNVSDIWMVSRKCDSVVYSTRLHHLNYSIVLQWHIMRVGITDWWWLSSTQCLIGLVTLFICEFTRTENTTLLYIEKSKLQTWPRDARKGEKSAYTTNDRDAIDIRKRMTSNLTLNWMSKKKKKIKRERKKKNVSSGSESIGIYKQIDLQMHLPSINALCVVSETYYIYCSVWFFFSFHSLCFVGVWMTRYISIRYTFTHVYNEFE